MSLSVDQKKESVEALLKSSTGESYLLGFACKVEIK